MKINVTIDGINISLDESMTILEAAKKANIDIPTLCYLKDLNKHSSCRVCMVDVGRGKMEPACVTPVRDNMVVKTNTPKLRELRKNVLELILANHKADCTACIRNKNCELQTLSNVYVTTDNTFENKINKEVDKQAKSVTKDFSKCINCARCIAACSNKQGVNAISMIERAKNTKIAAGYDVALIDSNCIGCGQCIVACPVGALEEKSSYDDIYFALEEETYHNIALISDQSYNDVANAFIEDPVLVKKNLVTILKRIGFDEVFDLEEYLLKEIEYVSNVLSGNFKDNKPLIYACSGGIKKELIKAYPESEEYFLNLENLRKEVNDSFKASYLNLNINKDVHLTRVENCTALLSEKDNGFDITLTTRQLAKLIKESFISIGELDSYQTFDSLKQTASFNPFYLAVKKAYDIIRLNDKQDLDINDDFYEYEIKVNNKISIKACVVNGLRASKSIVHDIINKENKYDFICVISCKDGCVNGGGKIITNK